MNYKKFFYIWMVVSLLQLVTLMLGIVWFNPIDIYDFNGIKGFNHYKTEEDKYLYVCKPYQVLKNECKAVLIGTSRVYIGISATLNGYQDKSVYNFGCNSLSLRNTEILLDFLYANKNPEKIFLGLDFFQFSKNNYEDTPINFSLFRLQNLSYNNNMKTYSNSLKDSFQLFNTVLPTIKDSYRNQGKVCTFVRGWRKEKGELRTINKKNFYGDLNSYSSIYRNWLYDNRSMECLERIIKKANSKGVKLYIFFNPLGPDFRSMIYSLDKQECMNKIKHDVVLLAGKVYDFNFSNEY